MSSKFTYEPGMPPAVRREIHKYLKKYEWLVPGWCQEVYVGWISESDQPGTVITSSTLYEYRRVQLTFYPLFLSDIGNKDEHVIHDLLHAFVSIVTDFAQDTVGRLVPPDEAPKYRNTLFEELRIRNESCVQDLAHCIMRHLTN